MAYKVDQEMLRKLQSVDDATLRSIIQKLVRAGGGSEAKASIATANVGMLRRKLLSASPEQINRLLAAVDEKSAGEILQKFRAQSGKEP